MFIVPISTDDPVRKTPWTVVLLAAVNLVILALTYLAFKPGDVFFRYGFIPATPHASAVFTGMFLHAGIWHWLGNFWFLWMFGKRVENMLGRWLFLPAYLLCGAGAAALYWLLNQSATIPCVGASGAISGIAGIFFVLFPRARFDLDIYFGWAHIRTIHTSTLTAVGAWLVEQALLGIFAQVVHFSAIAFWAHVGGFLTGVVIGGCYKLAVPAEMREKAEPPEGEKVKKVRSYENNELTLLNLHHHETHSEGRYRQHLRERQLEK